MHLYTESHLKVRGKWTLLCEYHCILLKMPLANRKGYILEDFLIAKIMVPFTPRTSQSIYLENHRGRLEFTILSHVQMGV